MRAVKGKYNFLSQSAGGNADALSAAGDATFGGSACPLCAGSCEAHQNGDWTQIDCELCQLFRIEAKAIKRLAEMTDVHRMDVRHDVWLAQAVGELLEISLAPVGSKGVFAYRTL